MKRFIAISFTLACLLSAFSAVLEANITNDGSEVVVVKIKKKLGRYTNTTVNPGQSILLPADTISVTINAYFPARGDEKVDVKIIDANGDTAKIKAYGETFIVREKSVKKTFEGKVKISWKILAVHPECDSRMFKEE